MNFSPLIYHQLLINFASDFFYFYKKCPIVIDESSTFSEIFYINIIVRRTYECFIY